MTPRDPMDLRKDAIRAQYDAALALLTGFDHAPRLAKASDVAAVERSPGVGRARFSVNHARIGDALHSAGGGCPAG